MKSVHASDDAETAGRGYQPKRFGLYKRFLDMSYLLLSFDVCRVSR